MVLQLILLYNFIRNKIKITNKGDKDFNPTIAKMDDFATTQINGLSYIFTLINFILGGIMKIIVEYYSTDG